MGQTPLDLALRKGHNEIIQMLVQKGGKCLQVCEEKGERRKLMRGQNQAKLDLFWSSNPTAMCEPAATKLQKALGFSARIASVLAAALPESEEIKEWFEDGRLPCSFSVKLLWEPILAQLVDFDQTVINKRNDITNEQQEKFKASQRAQSTQKEIEKLLRQLDAFNEKERSHADREETLLAELKEYEKLNVDSLKAFVRLAAQMERKLVSQMEAQLEEDKEGLFSLNEKGSPKLGLLLNCFGAEANTIQALCDFNSEELLLCGERELESMISALPKDQQIVVLYTRDRLVKGKLPYAEHDCAICDCETAEEMASFLNENGFNRVTADIIRQTGASGRGALLFLSIQDLHLERKHQKALMLCRSAHSKSKN